MKTVLTAHGPLNGDAIADVQRTAFFRHIMTQFPRQNIHAHYTVRRFVQRGVLLAFLKDHPEVYWLKPECICDIGMEFGGDGYLFTVYLLLADDGSGYDIRLDEYIND